MVRFLTIVRGGRVVSAVVVAVLLPVPSACAGGAVRSAESGSVTRGSMVSAAPPLTCPGATTGFSLSMSSDMVGQQTPVEAAQWYVLQDWRPPGFDAPADAVWTVSGSGASGVTVTTGALSLHALQLPDGTWAIDSGQRCV